MKKKSLQEMTKYVVSAMKRYQRTGTPKWTYETAAKDLPYQLGSLTKLLMQLKGERYTLQTKKEILHEVSDELADILSLVLFIAHELNIGIHEAWNQMEASDKRKIQTRS